MAKHTKPQTYWKVGKKKSMCKFQLSFQDENVFQAEKYFSLSKSKERSLAAEALQRGVGKSTESNQKRKTPEIAVMPSSRASETIFRRGPEYQQGSLSPVPKELTKYNHQRSHLLLSWADFRACNDFKK